MSWTGLKKAINRAGAQVMVKTGHLEQTHDKEYEFEEKRYKSMESSSHKLHKELSHYLETLRKVTRSQLSIGEALGSFYGTPDDILERLKGEKKLELFKYPNLSQEYANLLKSGVEELEPVYNQTVLNPLSRFNSYFIEVNEVIKKRQRKLLDYDMLRGKKEKLERKANATAQEDDDDDDDEDDQATPGVDPESLAQAAEAYQVLNDQLKSDLPKLINLRTPFLDPSFEAFVKIQLRFFNDNYNQLNTLQSKLDARTKQDYISGTLDRRLDDVLGKMRDLSIAK